MCEHMPKQYLWGRLRETLSKSDNICAIDDNGEAWAIEPDSFSGDVITGDFIKEKYVGVAVLMKKSPRGYHQLVDPSATRVPDGLSGPFYLPSSDEIVEKESDLPGYSEDGWNLPDPDRESGIEWDGTEQNIDSAGAEGRSDVFNPGENKNDLL